MSRTPPGGAAGMRPAQQHARQSARPAAPTEQAERVESLLRDLGSQLVRGGRVRERVARLPVGRPDVDRLLGGGFPRGALSEVSGASSSGRTSLALSLLAVTTASGELAGWVDGADAFDPPSAERLGVDLERVLWVRTPSLREALRASERLLETEGFPLVVLDWTRARDGVRRGPRSSPGSSATPWIRLARRAAATRTALLLLSTERLAGPHAELALEMQPARARFTGTPALLEELETRFVLVRSRAVPVDPTAAFEIQRSPAPHESAA